MSLHALRSRLAYIESHGEAWSKAVARGELDAVCVPPLGEAAPAEGSEDRSEPRSAIAPLRLARLARILGREIAAGLYDHDAELRAQDEAAATAADPIARAASALLDLTEELADSLARLPRTADSPQARWLERAKTLLAAQREDPEHGRPDA
jgi:hypothetical protein